MKQAKHTKAAAAASALLMASIMMPAGASAAGGTQRVAVIGFDYSDSSGEPEDQTADHAARLALFRTTLEADLGNAASFATATIPCMANDCTLSSMRAEDLLEECREAGVDFLVLGAVHKMSTLVGGGRVMVLDVAENRFVFDRVISFRGDDDDAFLRAAKFSARDIARTVSAAELTPEGPGEPRRGIR